MSMKEFREKLSKQISKQTKLNICAIPESTCLEETKC